MTSIYVNYKFVFMSVSVCLVKVKNIVIQLVRDACIGDQKVLVASTKFIHISHSQLNLAIQNYYTQNGRFPPSHNQQRSRREYSKEVFLSQFLALNVI
jgi:hypothetical protein